MVDLTEARIICAIRYCTMQPWKVVAVINVLYKVNLIQNTLWTSMTMQNAFGQVNVCGRRMSHGNAPAHHKHIEISNTPRTWTYFEHIYSCSIGMHSSYRASWRLNPIERAIWLASQELLQTLLQICYIFMIIHHTNLLMPDFANYICLFGSEKMGTASLKTSLTQAWGCCCSQAIR